jgi:hypothetical protein
MIPTGVATLFLSANVTVGTGASFVIYPRPWQPILASATASGSTYTYTSTGNSFPQLASLVSLANGARTISCGIKITSTSNATNDSGMIVSGLMPRDNFSPFTAAVTPTIVLNSTTENGLPFTDTTTATQGGQQFLNYEQTESFAFRKGPTTFYKPQDPNDFTFRNYGYMAPYGQFTGTNAVKTEDLQMSEPFFVVGAIGTAASSTMLIEMVLHVEYTTGPFVNAIVNTGMGTMTADALSAGARAVFGAATNVVKEGISAGFNAAVSAYAGPVAGAIAGAASRVVTGAAGNIVNRLGNYFASTDISPNTALVPTGRRGGFNMASLMEVD